ncbi:tRNA threonylcarbamoyl adenosine modification protein YeaZ [Glaciihabitans tibetensis]|uniref:tRNA threonylcarbamoyl adenosine modification protein YeaZ n=1 Tax=Glaciihabitans tibetensis TaxID=1266600 RepID=A0A2T0VBP6_9MICO|nr:tRNA (adenosine(37)-N6)-threonylcarbamoyltransferase complex dimerization subunit type 1 TsaB [Glaciihabitans tibetensis]PRY67591.1 tRNA threonylcarbamoyl adenosine modification protein YeaZ [Glaciihabitans tibetensis]
MLLAIDTSAGTSVAVVDRDRGVLAEFSEHDTRRHSEVIGTLIAEALKASGIEVAALSGVAVGMGPGPFTGLRVGIAAARAFAFGAGKPVVPVVSHDAIAFAALEGMKRAPGSIAAAVPHPLLVVSDARRREVYWSAYSGSDEQGLPIRVAGPGLARPDDLPNLPELTGRDGSSSRAGGFDRYERLDADAVSAAALGMFAESLYLHRRPFAGPDALYLRAPDVTMSAGPKRVS